MPLCGANTAGAALYPASIAGQLDGERVVARFLLDSARSGGRN
jgi:hypothetical protein